MPISSIIAPLKIFLGIQKYISMSTNENFFAQSHIFPRIRVYREKICDFHAKGQNPSVIASRPCIAYWWRGNHWGENLLRKTNDCPIRKKWKKRPVEKVFLQWGCQNPKNDFFLSISFRVWKQKPANHFVLVTIWVFADRFKKIFAPSNSKGWEGIFLFFSC